MHIVWSSAKSCSKQSTKTAVRHPNYDCDRNGLLGHKVTLFTPCLYRFHCRSCDWSVAHSAPMAYIYAVVPRISNTSNDMTDLDFNATMASGESDLSAFLYPSLCANTEREVDGEISPCEQKAKTVCSSCYIVQVSLSLGQLPFLMYCWMC